MTTLPPPAGLIGLISQLEAVLSEEEALAERRDTKAHGALLERKQALARQYALALEALARDPAKLAALSAGEKLALRQAGERLEDAAARNARALRRQIDASDLLLRVIVDGLKREIKPAPGYTPSAARAALTDNDHIPALAVSRSV